MADRKRGKLLTALSEIGIGAEDKSACPRFMHSGKHGVEFLFGAGFHDNESQAEAVRRGVEILQLRVRGWACRIDSNGKYLGAWKHLTHEFQALARDLHAQARHAG